MKLQLLVVTGLLCGMPLAADDTSPGSSEELAHSVTIHRDEWGVPHILGPTDQSVLFGMGYAQAEDNLWQPAVKAFC